MQDDRQDNNVPDDLGEDQGRDRVFMLVSLTGLLLLVFLVGAMSVVAGFFPGPEIKRAYIGGMAWYDKLNHQQNVYETDLWTTPRHDAKGVTVKIGARMQPGLTLYTSGDAPAAYLIDADGNLLHEWRRPFSSFHEAGDGGPEHPQPDEFVHFRHARVLPNGDLIALYEGTGDTPYGYGLVKLDKDSNILWKYTGCAHHQFDIAPDGRIFVLTHAIIDQPAPVFGNLATPRIEDYLVILSPDGREQKKIALLDAVGRSKYRQLVYAVSEFSKADPLHTNTVAYIDAESARNFAVGQEGQILLSFREIHSIAVLDPVTDELVWVAKGGWMGQHDPDILPNGNILLFDNFGNFNAPEGKSRVIEFNPVTMEIVWQYKGTPDAPFESVIRADQQRLANGNTLISESSGGRILEVTREGEIVWEFVNPARGGVGAKKAPIIAWSMRLDPDMFEKADWLGAAMPATATPETPVDDRPQGKEMSQ
ncbi:MAG: hypothetical protein EP335_05190 [Alphaproteobacteria bacterium]|nr:MAG: hypothetical protein EP335_05190 [Alphaproteobacteria bacterium]